jgi:hypothetical protein
MELIRTNLGLVAVASVFTLNALAQYPGAGGTTGGTTTSGVTTGGTTTGGVITGATGGPTTVYNFNGNYRVGFDTPEAWGLKYFASTSLLSGLQPPAPGEDRRVGSISVGFEMGWLPRLDAGQRQIGFKGTVPEDLNKSPIFARPVVRIGLPAKFTFVAAAPPPFRMFGVTTHLLALGLERPLLERRNWVLSWRGYGQFGSVKGAFTCPRGVLGFEPGSAQNPTECVAESADKASLRYLGSEFQVAYRSPRIPKFVPHAAVGGNFIDSAFQVDAQVVDGHDRTRLWTRGGTASVTGGVTYLLTKQASFTVDLFYTPLWVQRNAGAPRTNDGLFNVRALLNYSFQ